MRHDGFTCARGLALALISGLMMLSASAQQSPYRFNMPPGWTRSAEGAVESLVPSSEPAGTVQALLLAPKPLTGDFDAQFDAERTALEAHWGLQRPQPTPPQRGRVESGPSAGPYAAHFASYVSEGGPRYMSFLAIGRNGQFVLLVFVAGSDDAYNRLAPQVTQLWQGLQVVSTGVAAQAPPRTTP